MLASAPATAVVDAAAGRGVLVGVGVAAGAAVPQEVNAAPSAMMAMIRSQGQAVLIVKRDRIMNARLRSMLKSIDLYRYFGIPCRMPYAGRSMMPKAASSEPGCVLL